MELKTSGFVLSSRPRGEADRLVCLFTLQAGRVRASVRGARKSVSKLASSLELMNESDLVLHRRGGGDLLRLTQSKLRAGHARLKEDLGSIAVLQLLAETLEKSTPEGEPHPGEYLQVRRVLKVLSAAKSQTEREQVLASFVLKLLDGLGYPMELSRCAGCGVSLACSEAILVPHRGGALCRECIPGNARLLLKPAERAVLERLREWPLEKCGVLKIPPRRSRSILRRVLEYAGQTLETDLKTLPYYMQVVPL